MPYWNPTRNDPETIVGTLTGVGTIKGTKGAKALHLETDTGDVWSVVLEAPGLRAQLRKAHPRHGSQVAIRYEGRKHPKNRRAFHAFTVATDDPYQGTGDFDAWFRAVRRDQRQRLTQR